jgi:hypothetical protein
MDVEVSNDEDVVPGPKPDASVSQKKASTNNDTGDEGVSSVEPNAPNPISSGAPKQLDPSIAHWILAIAPPTSGHWCKRPPPATKRNKLILQADQVMTQVELPPIHRPHSPLDLVAIEMIFGRIFNAF